MRCELDILVINVFTRYSFRGRATPLQAKYNQIRWTNTEERAGSEDRDIEAEINIVKGDRG